MSEEKSKMLKLTGLYKNQSKDGSTYYSGNLSYSTKLLLFPNKYKEDPDDKRPDLVLYISKKEDPKKQSSDFPTETPDTKEGDIPF